MSRGLETSRYSPGNMKPEALEHLFVGREKLMGDVLMKIAASATSKAKHFFLLVGPRGVGKTHFVELLHHRLITAPKWDKARAHLKIAFLNEEEWGVASFLDLLVRILGTLAKNDVSLGPRIDSIYSLHERDPGRALEAAESLLVQHVGKDTLLLICENLEDLFEGLDSEGQQRWRAFIQEHPFWTILATAPTLFSAVQLQSSAFYGFFTIRKLELLDFEGAVSLLKRKAQHDGNPKLTADLNKPLGRARARAIHHLAGGSHRIYVIMSDFLTHESLDELAPPFMRMVDDLTPYYQDRVRLLAPQQRKLVEFLAHARRPEVVKDIAKRCLMSQQTGAKQLGELARMGFVRRTPVGRETYCELAEPLMRICFEVKDRNTEHIELFVEFLRRWFTVPELRSRYEGLKTEPPTWRPFERCHLQAALHQSEEDGQQPVHQALAEEAVRLGKTGEYAQAAEILSGLVRERGNAFDFSNLVYALELSRRQDEAIQFARLGQERFPNDVHIANRLAYLLFRRGQLDESLAVAQKALEANPKNVELLCLVGTILQEKGRFEEAISTEEQLLTVEPSHAHSYFVMALCQAELGHRDLALETATTCTRRFPRKAAGWQALTNLYFKESPKLALKALDKVQKITPDDTVALEYRVQLLSRMHRLDEALAAVAELVKLQPDNPSHRASQARVFVKLQRWDEALAAVEAARAASGSSFETWEFAALETAATVGRLGSGAAMEVFSKALAATENPETAFVIEAAEGILSTELQVRGPVATARALGELRATLARHKREGVLADVFTTFVSSALRRPDAGSGQWAEALPMFESAVADLVDCRVPLEMLSAGTLYRREGDETILLALPLEQRSLLREALGLDKASDAVDSRN